ncbi:MAG: hypothetical protein ACR2RE_22010 [Geminicoccaceae bacterium]
MTGSAMQQSATDQCGMNDFDRGLACTSLVPALLLGLAIDYGHWWLGVPSGLATLLMAGVFVRRHVFKRHPKPLSIGLQRDTKTSQP